MTELETVKKAVERLKSEQGDVWLYRLNSGHKKEYSGASGASRWRLPLDPKEDYFGDLAASVLGKDEDEEDSFDSKWKRVRKYNGTEGEECLFWLPTVDGKISDGWNYLHGDNPWDENSWLRTRGNKNRESVNGVGISLGQGDDAVEFFVARPPVKLLNHAFWSFRGKLRELDSPIITLPLVLDAVALGNRVYFFTPKFREQLWSREAEKRQVQATIGHDVDKTKLSNPELFKQCALKGMNLRRMSDFRPDKLKSLLAGRRGKEVGAKFGVRVENGKLSTDDAAEVDRLIKLVTNRGMMDPFEQKPMAVAGADKWE